ncbi:MAG TPA: helix-hairpin-helix domain-containing protein [Thermoanaerobaculia bacterium]
MTTSTVEPILTRNRRIAAALRELADLLDLQGANPFRITAYRRAADTVVHLDRDLGEILEHEGFDGLTALPHIGYGIAGAIREMLATGRWGQLDRLRGTVEPERLFQSLPGIGPHLARTIHDTLKVETLEDLEIAAHDGRLESVPGVGPRRANLIRAALAAMLGRRSRPHPQPETHVPGVDLLLDVDREYREKSSAGRLPMIAPRRFNPERKSWLPVLHTHRGRWSFTALYSNTARAHELAKTHDWVVLYFYDDHHREEQHTVVTETRGALAGRRVVRGREAECREHYERERMTAA